MVPSPCRVVVDVGIVSSVGVVRYKLLHGGGWTFFRMLCDSDVTQVDVIFLLSRNHQRSNNEDSHMRKMPGRAGSSIMTPQATKQVIFCQ